MTMRAETQEFHFTKKAVEAIPAPKKKRAYLDARVRGLALAVHPTGHKSFYWQRRVQGHPRWETLGAFPGLTVEAARDAAEKLNHKMAAWKADRFEGVNPFAPRRAVPSLDQIVDLYVEQQIKPHAKRPERAEKYFRSVIERRMAPWRMRRLDGISQDDVEGLHAKISAKHKRAANVAVKHLRVLYAFAARKKLYKGDSPAKGFKLNKENKRTRYLQPAELPPLFAALKRAPNPDLRDFVNLSLWTGARKMDTLSMRWSDVDLTGGNSWTVPDPKNQTPYTVPLTDEAIAILKDRLRLRVHGNPWVFPSIGKTGHLVDPKKRWKELLKDAGLENADLRIHDLRRTNASYQSIGGSSLPIIGKSLGHASGSTATAIYSQVNLDAVRNSVEAAGAAILAAMKKTQPAQLPAVAGRKNAARRA
jgi:integrase